MHAVMPLNTVSTGLHTEQLASYRNTYWSCAHGRANHIDIGQARSTPAINPLAEEGVPRPV